MSTLAHLTRFRVYRERDSRQFLCIAAARDAKHAIKIARQMFRLTRTAWATPERLTAQRVTP